MCKALTAPKFFERLDLFGSATRFAQDQVFSSSIKPEDAVYPNIGILISRDKASEEDFIISIAQEDQNIGIVRHSVQQQQKLSADQLAALSSRLKCFGKIIGELYISAEDVLVCERLKKMQQIVTIVSNTFVDRVIKYFHEGP